MCTRRFDRVATWTMRGSAIRSVVMRTEKEHDRNHSPRISCVRKSHPRSQFSHLLRSPSHALPSAPLHGDASRRTVSASERRGCQPAHAHDSHVVSEPEPFQTQLTVTQSHSHTVTQSHTRSSESLRAARRGRSLCFAHLCATDGSQSERGSVFGIRLLATSRCERVSDV